MYKNNNIKDKKYIICLLNKSKELILELKLIIKII